MWLKTTCLGLGDFMAESKIVTAYNRTGSAVVRGDLGIFPLDMQNGTYNTWATAEATDADKNVVDVPASVPDACVLAASAGSYANNAIGNWYIAGICKMATDGNITAGATVAIKANANQLELADATTNRIVGIALVADVGNYCESVWFCGVHFNGPFAAQA